MRTSGELLQAAGDNLQAIGRSLMELPWPVGIGILFVPALIAAFSRSRMHTIGAALLSLTTFVVLVQHSNGQNEIGPAMLAYCGALILAIAGYAEMSRVRSTDTVYGLIERMHNENRFFLEALDRRAQMIDRATVPQSGPRTHKSDNAESEPRLET